MIKTITALILLLNNIDDHYDHGDDRDNHDDDHDGSCVLLAMSMTDCLLMDGLVISRTTVVCEPQI